MYIYIYTNLSDDPWGKALYKHGRIEVAGALGEGAFSKRRLHVSGVLR